MAFHKRNLNHEYDLCVDVTIHHTWYSKSENPVFKNLLTFKSNITNWWKQVWLKLQYIFFFSDVPLGDNCECHSQCAGNNTVCEPGPDDCGVCACKDGFYRDGSVCIPSK